MKSVNSSEKTRESDGWPEAFGFSIYGNGPTHIIKVIAGTVASSSGLQPGDQILQVNSHDVSGWAAEDIVSLVLNIQKLPPSLGVVSRIREISITPSPISREFGFSLVGTFPVKIHQIKPGSSADDAGLNRNDIVIKIDGDYITSLFQARRLANNAVRNGGVKLSIIPAPSAIPSSILRGELPTTTRVKEFVKRFEAPRAGQAKAQSFIEKIKESLRDRPAVIEGTVRAIKQYSEDRDLEQFVYSLTAILDPPEELQILEELRIFMPRNLKQMYDDLVKKALKDKQSELKLSKLKNFSRDSPLPPVGFRNAIAQMDNGSCFVATIRQVRVFRRQLSFGLTLRGEHPVTIQSVDPGSAAEKAGLLKGDELLSLNGLDITCVPHDRAVALLQGSGSMPTLVIQTTSGALVTPGTSLHQMPCHASPPIDPQIYKALENMSVSTKPTTSSQQKTEENAPDSKDQNNNDSLESLPENIKVTKLNSTWTHRYVSPEFKIHGENFDQHLHSLLMPSERRVVKRALENYEANKNMHELLHTINNVLDNPHKWPVWYFVVQSMKGKERVICRKMLAEMLQSQQDCEKQNSEPAESEIKNNSKNNSEEPNNSERKGKARIRRRRSMKSDYNRQENELKSEESGMTSPKPEEKEESKPLDQKEESGIRVRRSRRRRSFAGIDLTSAYEAPHEPSDTLRLQDVDEQETHLPAAGVEPIDEEPRYYEGATKSLRRRRRETNLRRLQSAGSMENKEINMEKEAIKARNSLSAITTSGECQTASLRERRRRQFRRSLDGTAVLAKAASENTDCPPLVVKRKTGQAWTTVESLPETHIDEHFEEGLFLPDADSPITEETTRTRRRISNQRRRRKQLPETNVDDVVISENGNNNNANSLHVDEDSFSQTTDDPTEEESDMSLKSPLSMKGLRASFRISKKNKDINELKASAADSSNSSNDDKAKSKKASKPGFLERMGMGKKQQSNSESSGKEEGKSKKLFGKKSSSKKDSENKSKPDKSSEKTPVTSPTPAPVQNTTPPLDRFAFPDPSEFLTDDPPTPDHSFLVRNSKKRLTFSRPPKNSDTEAFLTELSAQFDDGFNILDDLAQALQEQANNTTTQNFGAKWSYLPNGGLTDAKDNSKLFQPAHTNDLSELNLSDIEDKKDETPPFPLTIDSADESGVGTMDTLSPSPIQYAYRDRELEWERERQNRKKKRRQAFASLTQDDSPTRSKPPSEPSSPGIPQTKPQQPETNNDQNDETIYMVPKVRTRTRRRRQNAQSRTETPETSYPPNTRFTRRRHPGLEDQSSKVSENYLANLQASQNQKDKENNSPTEQTNIFERARRRGYRVSGVEGDMENVFSEAEGSLQNDQGVDNPFPVDDEDFAGKIEEPEKSGRNHRSPINSISSGNIVYVDDDIVYAEPRSERSTAVRLRKRSQEYPSNGVLEGDLSFTDINSLLEACDDDEIDESQKESPIANGFLPGPPPPPPVPPPCPMAPPPPPPPPPMPGTCDAPPMSPTRMNVKRLNWQKIDPPDLKETVWGQIGEDVDTINDVVKYLDLEQHFATKKAREIKRMSLPVRSNVVSILSHKKAYNTSILLAHLKMTVSELRGVLLSSNNQKLDSSQYKQMLLYAPDDDEATKLLVYAGDIKALNEADQFARKMVTIPGYRLRLQALMYKQGFRDREEDVRKNLECLQNASLQLRKSKSLAKILEFVLAMGNYMNRGHNRISKATGFKIQFLADMDSTKTSDNKLTFLHILARAVYSKFPELCTFARDLTDVRPASKVVYPAVFQELKDMRTEWVEIRDRMPEALTKQVRGDRFKHAMEAFLVQSNGSLKRLELLLANTTKEFNKTARYFGENAKGVGMQQFFGIFGEFITKFEKADQEIKFIMTSKAMQMHESRR